jgi:hypothetical protein
MGKLGYTADIWELLRYAWFASADYGAWGDLWDMSASLRGGTYNLRLLWQRCQLVFLLVQHPSMPVWREPLLTRLPHQRTSFRTVAWLV